MHDIGWSTLCLAKQSNYLPFPPEQIWYIKEFMSKCTYTVLNDNDMFKDNNYWQQMLLLLALIYMYIAAKLVS